MQTSLLRKSAFNQQCSCKLACDCRLLHIWHMHACMLVSAAAAGKSEGPKRAHLLGLFLLQGPLAFRCFGCPRSCAAGGVCIHASLHHSRITWQRASRDFARMSGKCATLCQSRRERQVGRNLVKQAGKLTSTSKDFKLEGSTEALHARADSGHGSSAQISTIPDFTALNGPNDERRLRASRCRGGRLAACRHPGFRPPCASLRCVPSETLAMVLANKLVTSSLL